MCRLYAFSWSKDRKCRYVLCPVFGYRCSRGALWAPAYGGIGRIRKLPAANRKQPHTIPLDSCIRATNRVSLVSGMMSASSGMMPQDRSDDIPEQRVGIILPTDRDFPAGFSEWMLGIAFRMPRFGRCRDGRCLGATGKGAYGVFR